MWVAIGVLLAVMASTHATAIQDAPDRRGAAVALPQVRRESPVREDHPPSAPAWVRGARTMLDSHGRTIRDLRLSITDRCNFRCVYCMEPDVRFAPTRTLLTTAEIVRLATVTGGLGVRKIRLTGGEPTLHPDLTAIIRGIRKATSAEVAMISNGSRLNRENLRAWKAAGLSRLTISIDSIRPDRFARMTRSTVSPAEVLTGIEACLAEGLTPLKLNAVLVRGFNDDEAPDLAVLAREYGLEMRFIEYMPLDSGQTWDLSRMVPAAETRAAIEAVFPLTPCDDDDPSSTARTFRFTGWQGSGRIGFIAPVSSPFCGACSRLRITADGKVRPCLFSSRDWDLRPLLRERSATDDELAAFLIDATWTKQPGHGITSPGFVQPDRPMSAIGG